jgi:8-oxo-dGTP pyrophosphatase MutT (NUDIX family)
MCNMTEFSHAGGLVFRQRQGEIFFLIVRAKPDPSHWVIPKGHIEPGEQPEAAAIREIREEAGVRARIIATLGTLHFNHHGKQINTILYLLEYTGETPPEEQRECHWGLYKDCLSLLTFPDTKEMLRLAQDMLPRVGLEKTESANKP